MSNSRGDKATAFLLPGIGAAMDFAEDLVPLTPHLAGVTLLGRGSMIPHGHTRRAPTLTMDMAKYLEGAELI